MVFVRIYFCSLPKAQVSHTHTSMTICLDKKMLRNKTVLLAIYSITPKKCHFVKPDKVGHYKRRSCKKLIFYEASLVEKMTKIIWEGFHP